MSQIAADFGKSESAIRMWETGKTKPDADTLIKLANYFICSIDYLLGKSDYKDQDEKTVSFYMYNELIDNINQLHEGIRVHLINSLIKFTKIIDNTDLPENMRDICFDAVMNEMDQMTQTLRFYRVISRNKDFAKTQDAFISLFERLQSIRPKSDSFRAIALNLLNNEIREVLHLTEIDEEISNLTKVLEKEIPAEDE